MPDVHFLGRKKFGSRRRDRRRCPAILPRLRCFDFEGHKGAHYVFLDDREYPMLWLEEELTNA